MKEGRAKPSVPCRTSTKTTVLFIIFIQNQVPNLTNKALRLNENLRAGGEIGKGAILSYFALVPSHAW